MKTDHSYRIAVNLLLALAALVLFQHGAASEGVDEVPAEGQRSPIRVLIVDGYSNHDWQLTTKMLLSILESSKVCRCSVSTAPPTADSPGWDDWRPKFADYDVVVQTCNDIENGPSWPSEVQRSFEDFVKRGGGVLIFHSGNNAFPKWKAYNEIIGLGWRKKDEGRALTITKDGAIKVIPAGGGENTSHGARSEVVVHRMGEHPIHAGMPRSWKTPGLEVYTYARGPEVEVNVLSYGYDAKTNMNWPLEWTTQFGKGRVYSSTFGHVWRGDVQPHSMRCAGEQTLLARTVQWLAGRPVTVPVPEDFPTEQKVSVRPELKL